MPAFLLGSPFNTPYYEGGGSSDLAPFITDVAVGGHAYMIDWTAEIPLRFVSIPILRQQQDTSDSPGEQSINSESLWRRFGESWHIGAGQERFDRGGSSPFRFHRSQGVDVWNQWELGLLKDAELLEAHTATNLYLAVAGGFLYYTHDSHIGFNHDLIGLHGHATGHPTSDVTSITSNGFRVWVAYGSDGVYMTERGTSTAALHITGTVDKLAYVKNRVMAANGPNIYDVTALAVGAAGSALPDPLFTHGNTDWNWVGFAESQSFIYAAGFSGDKSLIYSLGVTSDGTELGQPVVAGALPDGEVIASVYGYLGRFLALGTNKGFRLALVSSDGALNIGALIETTSPVLCFEGQEEFIWYGNTNPETITTGSATGLGRLSTAQFSDLDRFVPAYANDLLVAGQTAEVVDVVTFENRRVFTVAGVGMFVESLNTLVESGAVDTGTIGFGITEPKTALYVDLQVSPNQSLNTPIEVMLAADGGLFVSLGSFDYNELTSFAVGEKVGSEFELRIILNRDTTNTTRSPSLLSWLLRAQPRPLVTNMIFATVLLAPEIVSLTDTTIDYNTLAEVEFLELLNQTKSVTTFQHNNIRYSVVVEDYELDVKRLIESESGMSGVNASCTLKLKRI